ncbi:hypothetical protein [Vogesella sp. LIG4]|uniref:hypothetical protein n=1 Tax=Vogesella sp. LIG4 TaxID=1192162 RepID=UPI00081FF504|nr:hypothetical protein [Vogesella sp. LIG4]SCK18705.1 cyanophycin synthetase [Vogesella sp. LIG4]
MSTSPEQYAVALRQPEQLLSMALSPLPPDADWPAAAQWLAAWLPAASLADTAAENDRGAMQQLGSAVLQATAGLLHGAGIPLPAAGRVVDCQPGAAGWQLELAFAWPDELDTAPLLQAVQSSLHWLQLILRRQPLGDALPAFYQQLTRQLLPVLLPHAIAAPSMMALLDAATAAGIPWRHEGNAMFRLGWGGQGREFFTSRSDGDSPIGIHAAGNKLQGSRLLRQAGLPTARQLAVHEAQQAEAAARQLGWPLVVKPHNRDRGEGVSTGIDNPAALQQALRHAGQYGWPVLLEQQAPGVCHRILVVRGEVIYVVQRLPVAVCGDGVHSVAALIHAANLQQLALPPWQRQPPLLGDAVAQQCLAQQGLSLQAVPAAGQWAALRWIESSADGGRDVDMGECIHPDNRRLALRAAALFGLELAGVDMISSDISQPWWQNGAIVNEVNAAPALGASLSSLRSMPRLMSLLWPQQGRIALEIFVGGDAALAAARQRRSELAVQGIACHLATAGHAETPDGQPLPLVGDTLYQRCAALLCRREVAGLLLVVSAEQWPQAVWPADRADRVQFCP